MQHTDIPTPALPLPDDPTQVTEFPPAATIPVIIPPPTPTPGAATNASVTDPAETKPTSRCRRQPPKRARISFDAPARLKARLDRTAHELDRSKSIILREALGKYLNALDELGGEP